MRKLLKFLALFLMFLILSPNNFNAYAHYPVFEQQHIEELEFLPEGFIMPRSGVLELTGARLYDYIRLSDIENSENINKIKIFYIPATYNEFEFLDIEPRFFSFEARNVRNGRSNLIYESSRREDLIENFGSTTSTFARTLTGSATSGFTANVGISAGAVSSSVGFSMNVTQTESTTHAATVPARTSVTIESAASAFEVEFDIWEVAWIGNSQLFRGTGVAHRPNGMWVRETHRSL